MGWHALERERENTPNTPRESTTPASRLVSAVGVFVRSRMFGRFRPSFAVASSGPGCRRVAVCGRRAVAQGKESEYPPRIAQRSPPAPRLEGRVTSPGPVGTAHHTTQRRSISGRNLPACQPSVTGSRYQMAHQSYVSVAAAAEPAAAIAISPQRDGDRQLQQAAQPSARAAQPGAHKRPPVSWGRQIRSKPLSPVSTTLSMQLSSIISISIGQPSAEVLQDDSSDFSASGRGGRAQHPWSRPCSSSTRRTLGASTSAPARVTARACTCRAAPARARVAAPGSRVQHVAPHVQWSIRAVRTRSERTALATLGCTERA